MSTVHRRVEAEFGFRDTGFSAGIARSKAMLAELDKTAASAQATTAKSTGSITAMAGALGGTAAAIYGAVYAWGVFSSTLRSGIDQIGETKIAVAKLDLAVGGSVEAVKELMGVIRSSPRGGIFSDTDVTNAVALAKTLDLTNEEIQVLLPSLRGMAAVFGEDLVTVTQRVGTAIESGTIGPLRRYGIVQADVRHKAKEIYGAELKDLDEVAQRWVVLQSVLDKVELFEPGEAKVLDTIPGSIRAIKTEINSLIETAAAPAADEFLDFLTLVRQGISGSWAVGGTGKRVVRKGLFSYRMEDIPQQTGPESTTSEYKLHPDVVLDTPPGGAKKQVNKLLDKMREELKDLRPEPFKITGILELEDDDRVRAPSRLRAAQRKLEQIERDAQDERDRRAALLKEQLEFEESLEAASWQRRFELAENVATSLYSAISSASLAFYTQEGNRRRSWLSFLGTMVKQEVATWFWGLGMKAAKEAAFHAIRGFASAINPFTAALAPKEFAAAAKYAVFAAGAGVAAAGTQASAARDMQQDYGGGYDTGGARAAESSDRRAFGLTFTRPVENLTFQAIVTINQNVGMYGTGHTETVRDLIEREALPALQDLADVGALRAA